MSLTVLLTPRAETQLSAIDSWWRAKRLSAPDLFLDEFLAVVDLLSLLPDSGQKYFETPTVLVRRYLLRASRHHVYYRHDAKTKEVVVVSVWGAVRGAGPNEADLLA